MPNKIENIYVPNKLITPRYAKTYKIKLHILNQKYFKNGFQCYLALNTS